CIPFEKRKTGRSQSDSNFSFPGTIYLTTYTLPFERNRRRKALLWETLPRSSLPKATFAAAISPMSDRPTLHNHGHRDPRPGDSRAAVRRRLVEKCCEIRATQDRLK